MTGDYHLRTHNLSFFSIDGCKSIGKEGSNNIYDIDVTFDKTGVKKAGFIIKAASLKIALEIIETLGQHTQKMNADNFNKFKAKHSTTVFRIAHHTNDQFDTMVIFKHNRARNDLEHAFKAAKYLTPTMIQLNLSLLKEIDYLAREWAAQGQEEEPDSSKKKLKIEAKKT